MAVILVLTMALHHRHLVRYLAVGYRQALAAATAGQAECRAAEARAAPHLVAIPIITEMLARMGVPAKAVVVARRRLVAILLAAMAAMVLMFLELTAAELRLSALRGHNVPRNPFAPNRVTASFAQSVVEKPRVLHLNVWIRFSKGIPDNPEAILCQDAPNRMIRYAASIY